MESLLEGYVNINLIGMTARYLQDIHYQANLLHCQANLLRCLRTFASR